MATIVEAIYEGGVLRPIQPVDLPEGERVEIAISPPRRTTKARPRMTPPLDGRALYDPELAARYAAHAPDPREAARRIAEIAALPIEPDAHPTSGSDHDRYLYGTDPG